MIKGRESWIGGLILMICDLDIFISSIFFVENVIIENVKHKEIRSIHKIKQKICLLQKMSFCHSFYLLKIAMNLVLILCKDLYSLTIFHMVFRGLISMST